METWNPPQKTSTSKRSGVFLCNAEMTLFGDLGLHSLTSNGTIAGLCYHGYPSSLKIFKVDIRDQRVCRKYNQEDSNEEYE